MSGNSVSHLDRWQVYSEEDCILETQQQTEKYGQLQYLTIFISRQTTDITIMAMSTQIQNRSIWPFNLAIIFRPNFQDPIKIQQKFKSEHILFFPLTDMFSNKWYCLITLVPFFFYIYLPNTLVFLEPDSNLVMRFKEIYFIMLEQKKSMYFHMCASFYCV